MDIFLDTSGVLQKRETDIYKAQNILQVQIADLEYAPELGIDLAGFITSDIEIQEETFKAYTVQQLANQGVKITDIATVESGLQTTLNYTVTK